MNDSPNADTQQKAGAVAPPIPWLIRGMTRIHMALHRLSGGKYFNDLGGDDVCFVEMTGAKSGRTLTIPLMYVPHGDDVLLVASQGGAPTHPAWYHNLIKNPDVVVAYRGDRRKMRARLARTEETADLWPVCDAHYAPYEIYRGRTDREIPIFVCEPA